MTRCPKCATLLAPGAPDCPGCGLRLLPADVMPPEARPDTPTLNAHRRFVPGTIVADRYRIVERVGRGGMGEVYRADDMHLDAPVALKFLNKAFEDDPVEWQRLRDEVRSAHRVSHANVCRVHDIGTLDGVPFLTMEFVDGEDLASLLLRIDYLSPQKAEQLALEICAGLKAIHDCGLVHRDLKPANIMFDGKGHARITDFGLALPQAAPGHGPEIAGTPGYMAPETISRGEVSVRSDIYALGLVLHEVFTGRHALFDRGGSRYAGDAGHGPGSPLRRLDPEIDRVLQRCLASDPSLRPASVDEVARLLPLGDSLDRAHRYGATPTPEEVEHAHAKPLSRLASSVCFAALVLALGFVGLVGSHGRVLPQVALPDPPAALEVRARDHLKSIGATIHSRASAHGLLYARDRVEHIAASDQSPARWRRLDSDRPAAVRFWFRASPTTLEPWHWRQRITPNDPPLTRPGMVLAEVDTRGRLERLSVVPGARAAEGGPRPADWAPLFAAAGLDSARFQAVAPRGPLPAFADTRVAWEGTDPAAPGSPLHLEAASFGGQVVSFALMPGAPEEVADEPVVGDVSRARALDLRSVLLVLSFLIAAWLARRHLRAGRADRRRATRAASVMMGLRFAHWILSGHPVPGDVSGQFALALAWALYDFAYVRIFYLAVEPYVRRLWPRLLISWMRLIDGRFRDRAVGTDLLVGALVGVAMNLSTFAHRMLPVLWGAPPGRPDNVGFVEPALRVLSGTWSQLAQGIESMRSAIILAMCFVVVLVLTRLAVRRAPIAIAISAVLFVMNGMPVGDLLWLDALWAATSMAVMLFVLFRFGLVAIVASLTANAMLQSTPFHGSPSHWSAPGTMLQLAIVMGGAVWGLYTAFSQRGPQSSTSRA